MVNAGKRLPVGIQNFASLIEDGFLYIDKTKYLYDLVHGDGRAYFLSRPRRFGKSLFLSTLRAYWEGRRELFEGLAINEMESGDPKAWQPHPVFYFDFNKSAYIDEGAIEDVIAEHLKDWEGIYGGERSDAPLPERFRYLIKKAYETTGKRAVVLVDEYDKPLLENGGSSERTERDKAIYKGFFSTLKSYDEYIRFAFLIGVTKFTKVGIFSDLNHLNDISMNERYSSLCGITEAELRECLNDRVEAMAKKNSMTIDECYADLKRMYDGYHFCDGAVGVYNPFSLIYALSDKQFGQWWFSTGTSSFLYNKLSGENYDVRKITEGTVYASEAQLMDYRDDNPDPVPLLYQSGYLTIQSYDGRKKRYTLGYPNEEVKYGFIEGLAPVYLAKKEKQETPLDIFTLDDYMESGDTDSLRDVLISLYAGLPYTTDERPLEQNFQNVVYIVFTLLGQFVRTEVHSALGRADVVVETPEYIYIMEFKRDASAKEALKQIEDKGYASPYAADPRRLIKIGANFDSEKRILTEWIAVQEG